MHYGKGLALALLVAVLPLTMAARSGGFPSRPNFQAVTVRGQAVELAPIICTAACSGAGLEIGQSVILTKQSDESRTNTTTLAADSALQVTSPPVGVYLVEATIRYSLTATDTQLFKYTFDKLATTQQQDGHCLHNIDAAAGSAIMLNLQGTVTLQAAQLVENVRHHAYCSVHLAVPDGSTIAFWWSQGALSANAAVVEAWSWMRVTRIS